MKEITEVTEYFSSLMQTQLQRIEAMKKQEDFLDYSQLDCITIGICAGDGIGSYITREAQRILSFLLEEDRKKGRIQFLEIEGLTLEKRIQEQRAIPEETLSQLKQCHVILKGPTTTPRAGDGSPNLESANVAMRKELDLFANMRPVQVKDLGIDWTFFRENTEGSYAMGSQGVQLGSDLAVDFTVTTKPGTQRIARLAFEYARKNQKKKVSIITKANVIKTTDGNFLRDCMEVAREYPEIETDDWYIDIATAKLIDEKRRHEFSVFLLPNLYGDIITDEAAEIQGGVGTAGSANIGKQYAMFEAIHGSAPRMVSEGRAQYADPSSILKASCMLLSHIGKQKEAQLLERALEICLYTEKKYRITGRSDGATTTEFGNYLMETIQSLI